MSTDNPLNVRLSAHWPHPPSPRQYVFLSLPHMEALYGGAGGGGKTDALLMAALQYVDVPGYAALLLRRTYKQLTNEGQLLDLSRRWLTGHARWDDGEAKWIFPSGATISFGHLDSDRDLENYSGPSYQFIGFDELTQFPETHYRFLFTRLRRTEDVPVPVRMRGASNPGGQGHGWVKRRFIDLPREPGRMFVPARLTDNPVLDHDLYVQALQELDSETRAQILDGDWTVRPPGEWVFDHHAIDAAERLGALLDTTQPEPAGDFACGVDWGDFATAAVPIWPLERGGVYIPPGEVTTSRQDLEQITRQILAMMDRLPGWFAEERYDQSFAQSNRTFAALAQKHVGQAAGCRCPGCTGRGPFTANCRGAHNSFKSRGRPNTYPVAFAKYKQLSAKYLRLLLRRTLAGETTRVLAISPRNTTLLEQMRDYTDDKLTSRNKGDDDSVDALIAGATPLARKHRSLIEQAVEKAKDPAAGARL